MNPITFFVPSTPKPQPRPRAFARQFGNKWQARVYESGTAEAWKGEIAVAARAFIPPTPLDGPVRCDITFYMPRPKNHFRKSGELKLDAPAWHTSRGDRDNLDKAVMDALTVLGMWRDDGQVCAGMIEKLYCPFTKQPGAYITITPL